EQLGRYSFLGFNPRREIVARGRRVTVRDRESGEAREIALRAGTDALHVVEAEVGRFELAAVEGLPPFVGGAVGYLAYDLVRFFERLPEQAPDALGLPDLHLMLAGTVVVFDHVKHRLLVVASHPCGPDGSFDYDDAVARIEAIAADLRRPFQPPTSTLHHPLSDLQLTTTRQEFEAAVRTAKEHIAAGDIFQVVLSHRLVRQVAADPFDVYRALRRLNPSPYLFFLDFGAEASEERTVLLGSSPEMMARLVGRRAEVYPIAGTRPRSVIAAEDERLAEELAADAKERAEHVMLVDLGRNDLGRVCEYGSVHVPELMRVERYSHVMHLVSRVAGTLRPELDAYDLVRATFPAGTVTGAPKVRAMEIIEELEGVRRGPYAGAIGYFGFNGNMDTCITIRTILMRGATAYLQAGAGIVADSDPTREWEETLHKARALATAIDMAEAE
ncbi:MAG TPA: anthranilate synthase component I, partial [Ardenticatenaceae bacterium]|nr:anthranilate synthase component I [Ardenticatenaceae bacterium]